MALFYFLLFFLSLHVNRGNKHARNGCINTWDAFQQGNLTFLCGEAVHVQQWLCIPGEYFYHTLMV